MKSVAFTRFSLLLLWVLFVIILMYSNMGRPSVWSPLFSFSNHGLARVEQLSNHSITTIYAITPTYSRPVQKAELTRLANTFRQLQHFHWILVEDSPFRSRLVSELLASSGIASYTHLHVQTPQADKGPWKSRGTEQRNEGLRWIRMNSTLRHSGVIFFADDDNTYSLQLFQEMRSTQKVAVWPVGFAGGRLYERPLVEHGHVVGWYSGWRAGRPFAIDMAGFAVNLKVILSNPQAVFKRAGSQPGMQESDFLKQITTMQELEPKATNCTKVLVWHTRTEKPNLVAEPEHNLDIIHIEI
ncbi:galactosylgalactosylxylosylprotein 3-beta-glucuronosyltransferase 2-like [Heterodontus francisci]|uniref:galactosylgalactosylxylosylprotein 3-beta-glucuronosyltransferase 2-like n=1 Tax=Heterodontus francisci TaxID=7792 RepID=UPI00355C35FC